MTTSDSLAKTIKKIVFSVNGHSVKTVTSNFRGATIPLTLSDTQAADVRATITTVQKKKAKKLHHHKHYKLIKKVRTVSASYLACS